MIQKKAACVICQKVNKKLRLLYTYIDFSGQNKKVKYIYNCFLTKEV